MGSDTYWVNESVVEEGRGIAASLTGKPALKTLAIVGSNSATRHLAPYDDPEVEIWLFNESAQKPEVYRRWDALLQIHKPEVYTSLQNWVNAEHWTWLQQYHGESVYGDAKRIWMQEQDPRVPNSVRYPIEGVMGLIPYKYLRSSPAMALALAIYLGYEHILLYGSELVSNTEYSYQATNYAFWIGFAHGRGINLELHCWKDEFEQRIYGYDGEFDLDPELYAERLKENELVWINNEKILKRTKDRLDVAMQETKFEEAGQLSLEIESLAVATGETSGAMGEAQRYSERENPISRQEFERVAARSQKEYNELLADMHHAAGKAEYLWNVWRQTGRIEALNQFRLFVRQKVDHAYQAGIKLGVMKENMTYLVEYDKRLTAAGGTRALGRQADDAQVV